MGDLKFARRILMFILALATLSANATDWHFGYSNHNGKSIEWWYTVHTRGDEDEQNGDVALLGYQTETHQYHERTTIGRGVSGALEIPERFHCSGKIWHPVKSIMRNAFLKCNKITSVVIPSQVTTIEQYAFGGCSSLTSITVVAENEYFASENGALLNKEKDVLLMVPPGYSGGYIVPASVRRIADRAFADCTKLSQVTIPPNVKSLGSDAFCGCCALKVVTIPSPITFEALFGDTFTGCTSLEAVNAKCITGATVHTGAREFEIREKEFSGECFCSDAGVLFSALKDRIAFCPPGYAGSYKIPQGVKRVSCSAFEHCSKLTHVEIPESVVSVGDFAFKGCSGLSKMILPQSVTAIGRSAFEKCGGLMSVVISENLAYIDESAFAECEGLTSVTIPMNVRRIERYAFSGCTMLQRTVLSHKTVIGMGAFVGCGELFRIEYSDLSQLTWALIVVACVISGFVVTLMLWFFFKAKKKP